MDRNIFVLGFLGMDKYEYMMYLSRVLYHLGKRVLMIDCSETGALIAAVPHPESIMNSVVEYRGIKYLDGRNSKDIDPYLFIGTDPDDNEFDCILIDYGFCTNANGLKSCDHLVYVTDQQAHNIRRVSGLIHLNGIKKSIILKNILNCKITPDYIIQELNLENFSTKQAYIVYPDEVDAICRLNSQYDGMFHFIKLSRQSKVVIKGLTMELPIQITKKEWKVAYHKAEKGE